MVIDGRVQYEAAAAGGGGWYNSAPTGLPGPEAVPALGSGLDPRATALLTALVPAASSVAVWEQDKSGKCHRTQLINVPAALNKHDHGSLSVARADRLP